MRPEIVKVIEYAKKGARSDMSDKRPPMAGPEIPPTRNAPL